MGAFIAKQPNGLYCRFSTVVDSITTYNMSEEEYVEMCVERARERAREELKEALPFEKVVDNFRPYNDSVENFNQYLKEMGSDIVLKEEDYSHMFED